MPQRVHTAPTGATDVASLPRAPAVMLVIALAAQGCALFHNPAASSAMQLGYEVAQQRAALAEAESRALATRLDRLETILRDQGLTGGTTGVSVAGIAQETATLRGALEELDFEAQGIRDDLDRYRMDQERRQLHDEARLSQIERLLAVSPPAAPQLMEGGAPAAPPPGVDGVVTVATPPPMDEPLPDDPDGRLAIAEARMAEGKHAAARAILEAALAEVSSDAPQVPEMQYRLSEAWFNEGRFKEAARAFQVVTDKYPRSAWAPWAMLRIGECFAGLGRPDAATTFYQGVVRNHPGTEAAAEARSRLGQ